MSTENKDELLETYNKVKPIADKCGITEDELIELLNEINEDLKS
ncbi:hypothetical protein ACV3W4_07355 [Clostridium perfringens]|nr:hypothetical protein [Clostridium perfringens]MDJ8948958.1 hypothetical protein [Clostridium perfringens]MDK0717113.1 hypothetical protein [Clostridium perfringens]